VISDDKLTSRYQSTRSCEARRSRFCGVRCGALDHGCQYSRRRRFEALTDKVRNALNKTPSKGKEIKIPGPDHRENSALSPKGRLNLAQDVSPGKIRMSSDQSRQGRLNTGAKDFSRP
jgi:hypothetical protein